jgi:integrase
MAWTDTAAPAPEKKHRKPLTDIAVRRATPATGTTKDGNPKNRKLSDGDGMYVLITPDGSKYFRLKYYFAGKERLLALGVYPKLTLAGARAMRDKARKLLAAGIDPGAERRAEKKKANSTTATGDTFEAVAREWLAKQTPGWAPSHTATVVARLQHHVFPMLGERPVGAIEAPEILKVLRAVEALGRIESAYRVRQIISQVIRFAGALGKAKHDPTSMLGGTLTKRKVKHHAAITDPSGVGALMRSIEGYSGSLVVRAALKMHALTFLRSKELRLAEWKEIDFSSATWRVPAERMKVKDAGDHIVPLSGQAIAVLRELHRVTGSGRYLFPGGRGPARPLSENAIIAALRSMGFVKEGEDGKPVSTMTAHGFRTIASTLLNERGERGDLIEKQLAHSERDDVRGAYNRAQYLDARRKMMQRWSDYLDDLATGNLKKDAARKARTQRNDLTIVKRAV